VAVRFGEFLRTAMMASAAAASALIVATLIAVNADATPGVLWVALGWWVAATGIGLWLGARAKASEPIRSLLAAARTQASLPELVPARTLLNRLWPLLAATVIAAAWAAILAQVPAVVAGFMIIWAFTWRHQPQAVKAIEDRDGVRFYVAPTRFWQPIRLLRTPGFRATVVEMPAATSPAGPPPG
jgi:hypothetical protein